MSRIRLTKTKIARLLAPDPSGGQRLHWDTELRGFGVLCSGKSNSKSYIVQRRVNGHTRRVTIAATNVLELDEARERAGRVLADMYGGVDPKAKRRAERAQAITLRQALEVYLRARKDLRPATIHEYERVLERHLSDWLDKPLTSITPEMVEKRHRRIKEEVGSRKRSNLVKGDSSANGAMRVLRIIWNHAEDRIPDLPDNPVRRLRRAWFPVATREGMVKSEDLPKFYRAIMALPNPVHQDYLRLLLFTGLRRNEAAALTWDEVDLVSKVIRLPGSRTKAKRKLDLPMSDFLADMLIARRALGLDGPYVFPGNSRTGHLVKAKQPLKLVADETGVEVTPHDLRRTFVTVAQGCEVPFYAMKGLVNHSLGTDVTAGYIQMTPEHLRRPMQKITNKLKELCKIEQPAAENVKKIG